MITYFLLNPNKTRFFKLLGDPSLRRSLKDIMEPFLHTVRQVQAKLTLFLVKTVEKV